MTEEYVRSLCFENRGVDFSDARDVSRDDLRYEEDDVVYFRPLKEILSNPRFYECEYEKGLIKASIDYGGSLRVRLEDYSKPRRVIGFAYESIDDHHVAYYTLDENGWAEDWMLSDKPYVNKKEQLMKMARYML